MDLDRLSEKLKEQTDIPTLVDILKNTSILDFESMNEVMAYLRMCKQKWESKKTKESL